MSYAYCVNHTGGVRCACGVEVETKRDAELRLPCIEIRGITGTAVCVAKAMPELAEPDVGNALAKLHAMLDAKCPECGGEIDSELEQGGVVTARPCKHVLSDRRKR